MPSGARKRKAAKKKKLSTINPKSHQGENNGGELSSPTSQYPPLNLENIEDNSSKDVNQKPKSSKGSSSSSSGSSDDESNIVEKNVVVLESAPAVESVPEIIPPFVDPVMPVDSLLDQVSQVFDEMQNQKNKDLVVDEQTVVVSETVIIKDDYPTSSVVSEPVLNENEVEKLISVDEKTSLVLEDDVASSTPPKTLVSKVNGANRANENDAVGHSNKQSPAASTAVAVQRTTTWKSCCGIFELFSGSERY